MIMSKYYVDKYLIIFRFNNFLINRIRLTTCFFQFMPHLLAYYQLDIFKISKKVIGGWNFSQYIKNFSKSDYLHHFKWENYKIIFSGLKKEKSY